MKVLVIPTWYPGDEDKLIGIYHKEFTSALNKYGIESDILYIDRQRLSKPLHYLFTKKKVFIKETNYNVYKYRMLNLTPINFDLQMKSYTHKLDKALKDYIDKNGKPDILHAKVTVPAGYAATIVGKKYNIPVVITEHTAKLERFFNQDPFKRYGLPAIKNSYYTTVSPYMREIALKYTNNCDLLPNQVDIQLFKNDIKRTIDEEFRLISVCALRDGKGIDFALKAIKILLDKGIKIHYDIIGDGFKEDYFKSIAKELKLEDHVSFLGRKQKEEIPSILENSHALLVASDIESFGIPAVEALASGLPVITTDCLGVPSIIDEKSGVVCKVNDENDMAEKITIVINNYSQYDKKYLESIAEQYSEENVIKKAKEIYETILIEQKG